MYQANYETGEIYIYDGIGSPEWGYIDAGTIVTDLQKMGDKRVIVRLSSPGGSVDEARGIYNALKRHKGGVDVVVDGSAYSAASYIAMAGERIVMAQNAAMMIHSPWTMAMGNAAELRKMADVLDKYEDSIIHAYAEKSGKDADEVRQLLAAETWYSPEEAVEAGFATEVGDIVSDAPVFAKAMYGGKEPKMEQAEQPKAEQPKAEQPKAGSRTPFTIRQSVDDRMRIVKALLK